MKLDFNKPLRIKDCAKDWGKLNYIGHTSKYDKHFVCNSYDNIIMIDEEGNAYFTSNGQIAQMNWCENTPEKKEVFIRFSAVSNGEVSASFKEQPGTGIGVIKITLEDDLMSAVEIVRNPIGFKYNNLNSVGIIPSYSKGYNEY
jgi:hypothetical protein